MEEAILGPRAPRTAGNEDVVGPRPGDMEDGAAGPIHTQAVWGADLLPGATRVDGAVDLQHKRRRWGSGRWQGVQG